jgi:hypothetical protein
MQGGRPGEHAANALHRDDETARLVVPERGPVVEGPRTIEDEEGHGMDISQLIDRMIRACRLDAQLYEEVEADQTSFPQAMVVVLLSSLAAGLAMLGQLGILGLVINALAALAAWYIWAFVTYLIGTRMLPEPQTSADHGELLRVLGFAAAPGMLRVFGIVPMLAELSFFVANVWMLATMIVAVRQALDYSSTMRAVGVCAIGWLIQLAVALVVAFLFVGSTAHEAGVPVG